MITNLYTEIGPERLQKLVNTFYVEVFANEILRPLFSKTERDVIEEKQFMFLTQFLGGPNLYSEQFGHPKMRMRHLPHSISNEAKEEWLICMQKAILVQDLTEELKVKLYNVFPTLAAHMVNR